MEINSDDDWLEGGVSNGARGQGAADDPIVDVEWTKLVNRYTDAGYREGITDGKLSTLQSGFDQGFNHSVGPSRRLGKLRGRASALLSHLLAPASGDTSALVDELRTLVKELGRVRRDDILPVDTERLAHEEEDRQAQASDTRAPGDQKASGIVRARTPETFELGYTDSRAMESLEQAMQGVSSGQPPAEDHTGGGVEREEKLLVGLEDRLKAIEQAVRRL